MATIDKVKSLGFFLKYRAMMVEPVSDMAEYIERTDIFAHFDIPRNHWHNVTNPNRKNEGRNEKKDHPFYIPLEFVIKETVGTPDEYPSKYKMLKEVCHDCNCLCLTPKEQDEIKSVLKESAPDPIKVLAILQKLTGE